jgi:hypothetical protein
VLSERLSGFWCDTNGVPVESAAVAAFDADGDDSFEQASSAAPTAGSMMPSREARMRNFRRLGALADDAFNALESGDDPDMSSDRSESIVFCPFGCGGDVNNPTGRVRARVAPNTLHEGGRRSSAYTVSAHWPKIWSSTPLLADDPPLPAPAACAASLSRPPKPWPPDCDCPEAWCCAMARMITGPSIVMSC